MNLIDDYQIAIEKVKWLVGQMSAEDLQKYPLVAAELQVIRERLNFLAECEENKENERLLKK
jgi:hypothetical protein